MAQALRIGLAGLGAASAQILPALQNVPGIELAAAADARKEARDAFFKAYNLPAFDTVEAMCASPDIDVIWVATPNTLHCQHTIAAANGGKHVICEKPMALSLEECDRMIAAAEAAGVQLLQGHSKIFDAPIRAIREVVASGRLGQIVQIDTLNFNDWLQRPRLASEVDTSMGGGLIFRQAPHQVDLVRYIAGGMAASVRATAGRHDPHFDTEGNFAALIEFENGAAATLSFNGYGHFDGTELTWNIGESGELRPDARSRKLRPRRTAAVEPEEKYDYLAKDAGAIYAQGDKMPFFGLTLVSCERGVIRQSGDGLLIYTEQGLEERALPRDAGRSAEVVELRDALAAGRTVFPDGKWGRATLEVCLAILESSRQRREITLSQQVPS
jgi:phthalate 4,5-cis-dihydrodiol dehydrogenase